MTLRHRVEDGTGLWQLKLPRGAAAPSSSSPARRRGRRSSSPRSSSRSCAVASCAGSRGCGRGARSCARRCRGRRRLRRGARGPARRRGGSASSRWSSSAATSGRSAGSWRSFDRPAPRPVSCARSSIGRSISRFRAAATDIPRGTPPVTALGLALGEQARRLLLHDPGVRLGSDPEDLHQLRVATRRLRAFLRAGRGSARCGVVGAAPRRARLAREGARPCDGTSTCSPSGWRRTSPV